MIKSNKPTHCQVCNKQLGRAYYASGLKVCSKHYNQYKKYEKFLDNNPRTMRDPNDYEIINDTTVKINCYDRNGNPTKSFIIDKEDLEKVLKYKWNIDYSKTKKRIKGITNTGTAAHKQQTVLPYYISNIKRKDIRKNIIIRYKNGNMLDCRKSNLIICDNINYKRISRQVHNMKWVRVSNHNDNNYYQASDYQNNNTTHFCISQNKPLAYEKALYAEHICQKIKFNNSFLENNKSFNKLDISDKMFVIEKEIKYCKKHNFISNEKEMLNKILKEENLLERNDKSERQ